mmetsp:Transcript_14681/g.24367  ORF Transcript_14681/g.24367 Transcript_14681/m.24367 type:complete len:599 (+) Transcript_14681:110-1906(+)
MPALDSELSIGDIVCDLEEFNEAINDTFDEEDSDLFSMSKKLWNSLCQINNGGGCYNSVHIDAKIKIISSITNYKVIMTPDTGLMIRCYGCCSKKKRQKKHNQKCALTTVQLIEAIYLIQAYDINFKCLNLIKECHQSQKFADALRQISSTTSIFEIKNTLESKSTAKEKLSVLFSRLEIHKSEFLTGKNGERTSSATPTRFRNIQVALQSNPSSSAAYVSYKKANKMLYDVASFGTSLLLFKIDEKLKVIEECIKELQKYRTQQIKEFDLLEVDSFTHNLISEKVLFQVKSDSERFDGDVHGRLVGAAFEWSELKSRVSSGSFLSSYFGSADDDIENLFSTSTFMSSSGSGSNVSPKSNLANNHNKEKKGTQHVSEFFNNIKLPHNKKPNKDDGEGGKRGLIANDDEPPIYNLQTKAPVETTSAPKRKAITSTSMKKYSSEDYLPPPKAPLQKMATSFEVEPPHTSPLPLKDSVNESFSLDVIDFEDAPSNPMSSGLLSDESSSSNTSSRSFSSARKVKHMGGTGGVNSNGQNKSIFSSKFNSKINEMSGSISRTASKASAKVAETKEKVSEKVSSSAPRRMLKNSYTSLKNKSDGF